LFFSPLLRKGKNESKKDLSGLNLKLAGLIIPFVNDCLMKEGYDETKKGIRK